MTICGNIDCNKKATFNIIGEKARYCVEHKTEEMVIIYNCYCGCIFTFFHSL